MHITVSDGASSELPHEGDVYRLNPSLCADFLGLGMRLEDTHCIRCGKEVNLAHRQNPRGCNRSCFLCGTDQHLGKTRPELVATVNIWWWHFRRYLGSSLRYSPRDPPEPPDRPHAKWLSALVPVMLKALERTMSTTEKAEAVAQLQAAVRMSETAKKFLVGLGGMVRGLPDEIFGNEVLNSIAQTVQLASTLHKESDRILLLATNQLQHTMRQASKMNAQAVSNSPGIVGYSHGIKKSSPAPGMVHSLCDGEDNLASVADFVGLSANIYSTVPQPWEAPSYQFDYLGGLWSPKRTAPPPSICLSL